MRSQMFRPLFSLPPGILFHFNISIEDYHLVILSFAFFRTSLTPYPHRPFHTIPRHPFRISPAPAFSRQPSRIIPRHPSRTSPAPFLSHHPAPSFSRHPRAIPEGNRQYHFQAFHRIIFSEIRTLARSVKQPCSCSLKDPRAQRPLLIRQP